MGLSGADLESMHVIRAENLRILLVAVTKQTNKEIQPEGGESNLHEHLR